MFYLFFNVHIAVACITKILGCIGLLWVEGSKAVMLWCCIYSLDAGKPVYSTKQNVLEEE